METNYATPVATLKQDCYVPVAEWEKLLMVWTLRSLNPETEGFTTISWAIQDNTSQFLVIERVNGTLPQDHMSRAFDSKEEALSYFMQMIRCATPPCRQGALPGLVEASANYIETYAYYEGFGGPASEQSHARVGGYN